MDLSTLTTTHQSCGIIKNRGSSVKGAAPIFYYATDNLKQQYLVIDIERMFDL